MKGWILMGLVVGMVMINSASAVTFVEKHFTDYYDLQFSDQYLWFKAIGYSSDKKQEISFTPCAYYNNQKQYIYSLKDYNYLTAKGTITKNKDSIKFGLDITANTSVKSLVNKLCFEISGNTSNMTAKDGTIWMGDIQIDFDDLKKLGFGIETGERQINITNLTGKTFDFDPSVKFNTKSNTIGSIDTTPLSSDSFVIAFCDDTEDDMSLIIYNTSGTNITGIIDASTSISGCSTRVGGVSVSAFNSTNFIVGWHDASNQKPSFKIFDSSGNNLTGIITAYETALGSSALAISVSAFNSTQFVIAWTDYTRRTISHKIYDSNGNNLTGTFDDDTNTGYGYSVSTAAFNSTQFVMSWFNANTSVQDVHMKILSSNGNNLTALLDVDATAGTQCYSAFASTFNSTQFVVGWNDNIDADATFRTYNSAGTAISAETDADTYIGASQSVRARTKNSTTFILSWYDRNATGPSNLSAAVYNYTGGVITPVFHVEETTTVNDPFRYHSVAAQDIITGLSICNGNFIIAYANSTTQADWKSYYINGTIWNGLCGGGAPPSNCWIEDTVNKRIIIPNGCTYPINWLEVIGS